MTDESYAALIERARGRVKAHEDFKRTHSASTSISNLYTDHLRLADTLATVVSEMHARELHHFETEQELARLRGVIQAAYNAWHMGSRQSAIDLLIPELGTDTTEAAP